MSEQNMSGYEDPMNDQRDNNMSPNSGQQEVMSGMSQELGQMVVTDDFL